MRIYPPGLFRNVRDHIPLEQGLRPYFLKDHDNSEQSQRPYSIRTRIKTTSITVLPSPSSRSETIFH